MQKLIGFTEINESLKNSFSQNKLHHSLLITGSKSIGKASFAKNFALEILQEQSKKNTKVSKSDSSNHLFAMSEPVFEKSAEDEKPNEITSHPDLLVIEKSTENRNINVEQIRQIADFVNKTPASADCKFVIIDAVDDFNQSSSNALLKILEEPLQNNFLILICHNVGRILPTLKSRCLQIKVKDLDFADFAQILNQNEEKFSENEAKFLGVLTNNSLALALNLKQQNGLPINQIYEKFLTSVAKKQIDEFFLKTPNNKEFSQEIFFETFNKITIFFLERLVFFVLNSPKQDFYFEGENAIFSLILQQKNQGRILDLTNEISDLLNKAKSLNLEMKQTISNVFNMIFYG